MKKVVEKARFTGPFHIRGTWRRGKTTFHNMTPGLGKLALMLEDLFLLISFSLFAEIYGSDHRRLSLLDENVRQYVEKIQNKKVLLFV